MLTRVRLRKILLAAIRDAATDAANNVYEYDWPTGEQTMPAVLFNKDRENKASVARTQPNFTTVATISLDVRLMSNHREVARKGIDKLLWQIEQAVLTNYELRKEVQQFVFVTSDGDIDSSSGKHVAHYTIDFGLEFFEDQNQYPAIPTYPFQGIDITLDAIQPADPDGTYPNPPFPNSVTPAPRTQGPDGRAEATLVIDLPQD